jgi:NADPH:quinone reductase-like Zn-dependent oxidoreductase
VKAFEIQGGFGLAALRMVERTEPQAGLGQVVVRMRAAALNYRDLLVVRGQYNPRMPLPRVPLSDGAGEVVELGSGVTEWAVGDRVAGCFFQDWSAGPLSDRAAKSALGGAIDGVAAELVAFRSEGLVRVPKHLNWDEAATLPCAAVTAWHALVVGGLQPGQTVLTLGTGGVSLFALQFAKLVGSRVILTSGSNDKLARARELGADEGINYRNQPEWDRRVRELTGGEGVDQVVELGGAGTLPLSMRSVRSGGRINLIGVLTGAAGEVNPLPAVMKGLTIQGIFVGSRAMFEAMNRALEHHQVRPVIDRSFGWADLPAALTYLESGQHFGKIVVNFVE